MPGPLEVPKFGQTPVRRLVVFTTAVVWADHRPARTAERSYRTAEITNRILINTSAASAAARTNVFPRAVHRCGRETNLSSLSNGAWPWSLRRGVSARLIRTGRRCIRLDIKAVAHAFHVGIPRETALIGLNLDLPCALQNLDVGCRDAETVAHEAFGPFPQG